MTLAQRIANLRNARKISQAELAEALEVSRQAVSKWENGTSTPELEKVIKLAQYFGLTLDELVNGTDEENTQQPDVPQSTAVSAGAEQSKIRSMGIRFLWGSALAAVLCTILFGWAGILFSVPFFLFGLICYYGKHCPVLKGVWVEYLLFSLLNHYGTGLNPRYIWLTFQWTPEMNYNILFFSWVWFAVILALVIGTAAFFRRKEWTWTPKEIGLLLFGIALCVLGSIPDVTAALWGQYAGIGYLLSSYMTLAGITILVTDVVRWIFTKQKSSGHGDKTRDAGNDSGE